MCFPFMAVISGVFSLQFTSVRNESLPVLAFKKCICVGDAKVLVLHGTGGYDKEEKAARAYDLAALKYWGSSTTTNFPVRC